MLEVLFLTIKNGKYSRVNFSSKLDKPPTVKYVIKTCILVSPKQFLLNSRKSSLNVLKFDSNCPSSNPEKEDISIIKGFRLIFIYF